MNTIEADTLNVAIEILPNTHLWGYMFIFAGCIHLLVAMLFFANFSAPICQNGEGTWSYDDDGRDKVTWINLFTSW